MTIKDLTQDAKPVSHTSKKLILNHYDGYFKNREYSRFDMSLVWLSKYKNVPRFYFKIVDGCLCILKKQSFGVPYLWLIVPPMHINGNLKKEKKVLEVFKEHGVNCRLSEEDIILYGYKNDTERRKKYDEFIYRAGDFDDLTGKKMKRHRHRLNQATKRIKENEIFVGRVSEISPELHIRCTSLVNLWEQQTGNTANSMHEVLQESLWDTSLLYIEDLKTGELIAMSICERINKHIIGLTGYHDYNCAIKRLDNIIHYLECQFYSDQISPNTMINLGMGGRTKGLLIHKLELRPHKLLEIYAFTDIKKITFAEWRESCKQNKLTLNNERLW